MNSLQELFNGILSVLLCFSPFILLGIVGVVAFFVVRQTKMKRIERLKAALGELSNAHLPGIESVIRTGVNSSFPLTKVLVGGAHYLQQLANGDVTPLEKRTLNNFIQGLRSYIQRASFGKLTDTELNASRQVDLRRIETLANTMSHLVQAAEKGNAKSVEQYLHQADDKFYEAYEGHVGFRQELVVKEIQFPVPQPVHMATTASTKNAEQVYARLLYQMPQDQQMLFMMQYNNVRKNPTTAVLLAVLLGGVGAHKFYMGQTVLGVVYILFSWTWIPLFIGIAEAFGIASKVHEYNVQRATEIAYMMGATERRN